VLESIISNKVFTLSTFTYSLQLHMSTVERLTSTGTTKNEDDSNEVMVKSWVLGSRKVRRRWISCQASLLGSGRVSTFVLVEDSFDLVDDWCHVV
jgi:hypothetical protein